MVFLLSLSWIMSWHKSGIGVLTAWFGSSTQPPTVYPCPSILNFKAYPPFISLSFWQENHALCFLSFTYLFCPFSFYTFLTITLHSHSKLPSSRSKFFYFFYFFPLLSFFFFWPFNIKLKHGLQFVFLVIYTWHGHSLATCNKRW